MSKKAEARADRALSLLEIGLAGGRQGDWDAALMAVMEAHKALVPGPYTPANCPHCSYDRQFPGFESGGWLQQDNNGPIVPCPLCNKDGTHPRGGP